MAKINRCNWVTNNPIYIKYHDEEWGVPSFCDRHLFEMLSLEGAQAGLSWITILKRRDNYQKAFANFDPLIVSQFDDKKIDELLQNDGIVRNKLKVHSVITNAQAFLNVVEEFGSFEHYIWRFVDGKPILNKWKTNKQVPSQTSISKHMSDDLKSRGFKFIGLTICYAFMQATGLVNDHTKDCYLYHNSTAY